MSTKKTSRDELRGAVEAAYEGATKVLFECFLLLGYVRRLTLQQWRQQKAELARIINSTLRGLGSTCFDTEQRMQSARGLFRAAFAPPCLVNGTPQHSYHEGVLYLATIDIISGTVEVAFECPDFGDFYSIGLHHYGRPDELKPPTNCAWPAEEKLVPRLAARWRQVRLHLIGINVDRPALQCALDKELARVSVLLPAPLAKSIAPRPWSQPQKLQYWMSMWGDGSDNTTRKRLRKLEQAGSVKKDGKYWQVDVNAIPLNPTHYWKPPQTPHYAAD